jgi:hypothetical protein
MGLVYHDKKFNYVYNIQLQLSNNQNKTDKSYLTFL